MVLHLALFLPRTVLLQYFRLRMIELTDMIDMFDVYVYICPACTSSSVKSAQDDSVLPQRELMIDMIDMIDFYVYTCLACTSSSVDSEQHDSVVPRRGLRDVGVTLLPWLEASWKLLLALSSPSP